jgi:hypothetical protein
MIWIAKPTNPTSLGSTPNILTVDKYDSHQVNARYSGSLLVLELSFLYGVLCLNAYGE